LLGYTQDTTLESPLKKYIIPFLTPIFLPANQSIWIACHYNQNCDLVASSEQSVSYYKKRDFALGFPDPFAGSPVLGYSATIAYHLLCPEETSSTTTTTTTTTTSTVNVSTSPFRPVGASTSSYITNFLLCFLVNLLLN
jgi:hypothetical protein